METLSPETMNTNDTKDPIYHPNQEVKFENEDISNFVKVEMTIEEYDDHVTEPQPASEQTKLQCPYCPNYISCQKNTINKHILNKHTTISDNTFLKCGQCSFQRETKVKLLYTHRDKSHQCPYCPFNSKSKDSLQKHVMVKHTTESEIHWFHCNFCDYRGKCRDSMIYHFKTKHIENVNLEVFQCQECEYSTKIRRNFILHIKSRHSADGSIKRHQCSQCSYRTKRKYYLKLHRMSKHPS